MKKLVLLLSCLCLAHGGPTKKQVLDPQLGGYDYEYAQREPSLHLADSAAYLDSAPGPLTAAVSPARGPLKPGFSVGGPLASIAKGAAEQAHIQLSNQQQAAGQAAYVAKNTLAQAAAASAATAAAALAGKQIVVQGLEQQSRDAHVAVDGENLQLQQAERAASAARTSAKQAMHQLQARIDKIQLQQCTVITAALNAAQTTADRAAQAAAEAAAELAAQTTMLGQAKARAETVDEQLSAARLDYDSTENAAEKAATAAAAAQNNAQAAAASVADGAGDSALLSHQPVEAVPPVKLPQNGPLRHPIVVDPREGLQEPALLSAGALKQTGGLLASEPLGHGPIQASGPLLGQGQLLGGPLQGPLQGHLQGPLQGHLQGPVQGHLQGPVQGPLQGPLLGPDSLQEAGHLRGPSGLLSAAALQKAGGLGNLAGLGGLDERGALLASGAQAEAAGLRASNGLYRSELISLANSLPADGYDAKGYRY